MGVDPPQKVWDDGTTAGPWFIDLHGVPTSVVRHENSIISVQLPYTVAQRGPAAVLDYVPNVLESARLSVVQHNRMMWALSVLPFDVPAGE